MTESAYAQAIARTRETALLESAASILNWDQEVMMPPGGVEHRARELQLLARLAHERRTAPQLGDLLAQATEEVGTDGDPLCRANLRELRRRYERACRVPADLVAALAETTSLAQHHWAAARAASDFAAFEPWLTKVVALVRAKASCLRAADDAEDYDALLEEYEPSLRSAHLEPLFAPLLPRIRALLERHRTEPPRAAALDGKRFDVARQQTFVRAIATALGFDFTRGRLDLSTHPFCGGSHRGDVRITTRYAEDDLLDGLGSTIHEVGHGIYEQGLPAEHIGTPLGEAVSLGIHESQSRLYENQVGRGRAFWRFATPLLREHFGAAADGLDADTMFAAANRVRAGFIRVDADEVTYNLHVMVRCRIERDLIAGRLAVADVPAAWNAQYRDVLGLDVPDDRRGCLQDVHWSCGLIGYFATYTLGNLYAAQLFEAAGRAIGDLDAQFARGEFTPLREWLNANVHAHGQRHRAAELCERATGAPLSPEPFLRYLERKTDALFAGTP